MDYVGIYKKGDICGEGKINGKQKFTVENISAAGIKIRLKTCLTENEKIKVNFIVKNYFFEKHIISDGLVIRHISENEDHIYEIDFVNLSNNDAIQIDEIINSFFTLSSYPCQSFSSNRNCKSTINYWRKK